MKDEHPIDDLFARALHDAEASPPPRVWDGVVRERDRRHPLLLQLRRRWGWLVLALLVGAGTALVATGGGTRKSGTLAQVPANTAAIPPPEQHHVITAAPAGPAADPATEAATTERDPASEDTPNPVAGERDVAAPPTPSPAHAHRAITAGATGAQSDAPKDKPSPSAPRATGAIAANAPGPPEVRKPENPERPSVAAGAAWGAAWLPLRHAPVEVVPPLPVPLAAPPYAVMADRPAWWVAIGIGPYRESRTWHGSDAGLVRALQGTETPHYTTALGIYTGWEWRGGWGLSTGMEYSGTRYDFRHLDRFQSRHDSLVTHVVTFNASVIGSFTDTIPVVAEVQRPVASMNRYASVYIPVEGSWHRSWFRWHYGIRAGVGLGYHIMRSGITLVNTPGGTRSVDVDAVETHTDIQVGVGLGLDLGYAFNERLAIWATPHYGTGLFSLQPTDGTPHTITTRTGLRVRLAYTLRP